MKANAATLSRQSVPLVTQTMIVCGDCAGVDLYPLKTFLTSAGTCSRCAGRNYELAAKIAGALTRHLLKQGELSRP